MYGFSPLSVVLRYLIVLARKNSFRMYHKCAVPHQCGSFHGPRCGILKICLFTRFLGNDPILKFLCVVAVLKVMSA